VRRHENKNIMKCFRGDAAFAKYEIYEYIEENGLIYSIHLPAYDLRLRLDYRTRNPGYSLS